MAVAEEIMSPELILVSPPDVAAQAREALPDFEAEWELLVARLRAEASAAAAEAPARLTFGAALFTVAAAAMSAAPLVLLILFG